MPRCFMLSYISFLPSNKQVAEERFTTKPFYLNVFPSRKTKLLVFVDVLNPNPVHFSD